MGIARMGILPPFVHFLLASYGFLLISVLSVLFFVFLLASLGIQALAGFQGPIFKSEIIFSFLAVAISRLYLTTWW